MSDQADAVTIEYVQNAIEYRRQHGNELEFARKMLDAAALHVDLGVRKASVPSVWLYNRLIELGNLAAVIAAAEQKEKQGGE